MRDLGETIQDYDRAAIIEVFLAEAEEQFALLEQALLGLEARPHDPELLATAFRAGHTLKGNALSLGYTGVGDVAHAVEDRFERLRTGSELVTPDLITLLLQAVDVLRELVAATLKGEDLLRADHQRLLERLAGYAAPAAAEPASDQAAAPEHRERDLNDERTRTLRVDVVKLDRMMDLAGEVGIAHGRVHQALERGAVVEAREAQQEAARLFLDLQEMVLRARMVPVGPAFRPYVRTVRDVALGQSKQAALVIEGEDVEVDTSVIEQLRDPLTHMIRNAIDHGLELPEDRLACGKPACGEVRLRAYREAGSIVLELSDDGAGLDRARIAERGQQRGLLADAAHASDAEVLGLIFEPGFSTAATITEISGRGVGMDVVRRNVEALRGTIGVASRAGHGTTFTIRLPLTLAIIEGFGVAVAGATYVVPLSAVSQCVELPEGEQTRAQRTGVLDLGGQLVPYLRLRDRFGRGGSLATRECVLVVQHGEGRVGLVVDALLGERHTVIKPLGPMLRGLPGIAGSAVLGSGEIALILDVPSLMREDAA